MQFQSGVFVLVASVTGVLGAGEEVAVDFGLEDGGDEVGGVVVVAGAIAAEVPLSNRSEFVHDVLFRLVVSSRH